MTITVKLFATLRESRFKEREFEVPEDSTPLSIASMLELPMQEVAIVMINGRGATLDSSLRHSDVLALFPPVGGG